MNHRQYLTDRIRLCGESDQGTFPRTFRIKSIVDSTGASAVCYEAGYDKSGVGVLKEFYPLHVHSFTRDAAGQLHFHPETEQDSAAYEKLLTDYTEPYRMLMEMRREGDLATFIPPFEIYHGCDENGAPTGSVYIWSPEPALETFGNVCTEIHEHPTVRPEYNLVRVLYSIESLVKCVCALHHAGLLHRDIKPSNFGFLKRRKELLTQSISLFDLDTVCSVYHVPSDTVPGTRGYMEPEAVTKKANNQTDIYAIGATLFHAVIVSDSVKASQYQYDPSYYKDIKELVDHSELIQASESNSHPHLRHLLTHILQKTLCGRDNRYPCCEELLADIQKALYYVVPAELADRGNAGEQWVLADADKLRALDGNPEKNSTLALQYHLYSNPLYMDCPAEKSTLDVLVVGCGTYGQKFLDLALPVAQIPGKRLRVTVVSSEMPQDRSVYLEERPALAEFFNIDGSLPDDPDSYGDIRFVEHTLSVTSPEEDSRFFRSLLDGETSAWDYAFVATRRDSRNLAIARTLAPFCRTSFAWEGKQHIARKELQGLLPVYVSQNFAGDPFFAEIERMAFNVHLIWNKHLNINFADIRKEFRKPYNHNSCTAFVLAMKYKLYGIGLDIDAGTPSETAAAYLEYIKNHKTQKLALICFEHRRWNTEKLCQGYTAITDLSSCANGKTRDEKLRQHVCLVRSTPKRALNGGVWMGSGRVNRQNWDHPTEAALARLDELERVSVELHLLYRKQAEWEKEHFNHETKTALMNHIERDADCVVAFQEFQTCMNDIWSEDAEQQWKRYAGLRQTLFETIRHSQILSERDKKSARSLLESLHGHFYPILASQQYRDYKQDDVALIEGIPFILTYSDKLHMVIPYATGTNTQVFSNLAAPTVVNPYKLLYLAYCSNIAELDDIRKTLPYISSYMKKKEFRAGVEFLIGFPPAARLGDPGEIEQEFRMRSGKRVHRVKMMPAASRKEFTCQFMDYLMNRQANKPDFLFASNDTNLSGVMEGADIFQNVSSYRYDAALMQFEPLHDCDLVKYIRVKPFITVADLFSFKLTTSRTSNKPEFYEKYRELWGKYRLSPGTWKYLCRLFQKYAKEHDVLGTFRRGETLHSTAEPYYFTIPSACRKAVSDILETLRSQKIIGEQSSIQTETTRSCRVFIADFYHQKEVYNHLFSRIDLLMQSELIRCEVNPVAHIVEVWYNNLVVRGLDCSNMDTTAWDLLDFFKTQGYLIAVNAVNAAHVSFTYATPEIKDLLTVEGRMLEIYTYHKCKETGAFHDIRSSFEINWENDLAVNEFDCVLTKGFSVLFVECKAQKDLKPDFYNRLYQLTEQFGINARAVLIADTMDTPENQREIEHGKQLGIITISDKSELSNIGYRLASLL